MKRVSIRVALVALLAAVLLSTSDVSADESQPGDSPSAYARWPNGLDRSDDFFPIAVWLQAPRNAPKYRAIGINLYIGLWKGPTAEQLATLKQNKMPVICSQNQYALQNLDEPIIVGWMHGDEPDNAQSLGQGKGYGPPILPERIVEDYRRIKANDPSRPVILNLGQGVAWDGWHGRGTRTNHPEDYPLYVRGCDIASFDIYPAVHGKPAVAGNLWYVGRGVDRLRKWARDDQIVWNCIECTHINNPKVKPTPGQVKAEVWMSIIHGSRGIIYFSHQFQPRFIEAGLLADREMADAVAKINREVRMLAAVINSRADGPKVTAATSQGGQIAQMVKRHADATYLFAVNMRDRSDKVSLAIDGLPGATAEVLFEGRTIAIRDGRLVDDFSPYGVHRYRIAD